MTTDCPRLTVTGRAGAHKTVTGWACSKDITQIIPCTMEFPCEFNVDNKPRYLNAINSGLGMNRNMYYIRQTIESETKLHPVRLGRMMVRPLPKIAHTGIVLSTQRLENPFLYPILPRATRKWAIRQVMHNPSDPYIQDYLGEQHTLSRSTQRLRQLDAHASPSPLTRLLQRARYQKMQV